MSVIMMRRMHSGSLNKKWSKRYFTIKNVRENDLYLYLKRCQIFQSLKYRINNGSWIEINTNNAYNWILLQGFESIEFSGIKDSDTAVFSIGCVEGHNSSIQIDTISTHEIHVKGNVMSLIYGDEFLNKTEAQYGLRGLFMANKILTDASKLILPATSLVNSCYAQMFSGCAQLVNPPKVLPAEYGPLECYTQMFSGCAQLVKTPLIRMTNGYNNNGAGYGRQCDFMFSDCVNLTKAEIWFAISGAGYGASRPGAATDDMFSGCAKLKELYLYAPKLTQNCYNSILGSSHKFSQPLSIYIYARETDVVAPTSSGIWSRYFNNGNNWPVSGVNIYMLNNTGTFFTALKSVFTSYRPQYGINNTLHDGGIQTPPTVDLDTGEPI